MVGLCFWMLHYRFVIDALRITQTISVLPSRLAGRRVLALRPR